MAAAAQMPEAEPEAIVRGMVERLAARLDTQPDDVDGWMRLGRARSALRTLTGTPAEPHLRTVK